MSRMVEANETNTMDYGFYLNSDGTKCLVHETSADSEAALALATSVASQIILPKVFSIANISRFDVYGSPSQQRLGI